MVSSKLILEVTYLCVSKYTNVRIIDFFPLISIRLYGLPPISSAINVITINHESTVIDKKKIIELILHLVHTFKIYS